MVSYALEAALAKNIIKVLSDDIDVLVLPVYLCHDKALQCKLQMVSWDSTVLDINTTYAELSTKRLQLPGVYFLNGCDIASCPYWNDLSMAKIQVMYQERNQNHDPAQKVFLFVQSRAPGPCTSHVAEGSRPTGTTRFLWGSFPVPVTTTYDPGQPELIDVIQCQCKTMDRKCSTDACGCWIDHISCTPYCCAVLWKDASNHIQTIYMVWLQKGWLIEMMLMVISRPI